MGIPSPEIRRRFVLTARAMDRLTLERCLDRARNRELAVALASLRYGERQELLGCLSPTRARRIREEMAYHSTLRISDGDYEMAMQRMVDNLAPGPPGRLRGYVRPVSRRRPL